MNNLNDLEVCRCGVCGEVTSIYLGGLSNLVKATNDVNWHEQGEGEYTEDVITLKEIYEQLQDKSRLITVFVNTPLGGAIYQCGNYEDGKWVEYGTTMGYA